MFDSILNTPLVSLGCVTYRSSRPEVFLKKVSLEISQNSQKNTCARVSFLIKLQASGQSMCDYHGNGSTSGCSGCNNPDESFGYYDINDVVVVVI